MPLWFNSKVLGCLLPSSFLILSTLYLARNNHVGRLQPTRRSDPVKISSFYQTWCSIRQLQRDWERILNPCEGIIKWGSTKEDFKEPTDPIKSAIVALDIRPTCTYSFMPIVSCIEYCNVYTSTIISTATRCVGLSEVSLKIQ